MKKKKEVKHDVKDISTRRRRKKRMRKEREKGISDKILDRRNLS